jgi:pyrrolysine biosynthesis protein PylC
VVKIGTQRELDDFVRRTGSALEQWVLQEYLEGPSYSIEVFGYAGRYLALQVTGLEMDRDYDCKRVVAPVEITESLEGQLREMAITIARGLRLTGIMDVEFIVHQGTAKVLEIDARLPSQTPTAVYQSTGVNMLKLLAEIYVGDKAPVVPQEAASRGVIYEHVRVSPDGIEFRGEHIIGEVDSLELVADFFGADLGLTNYRASVFPWVATLIITDDNLEQAWLKREQVISRIRDRVLRDRRD